MSKVSFTSDFNYLHWLCFIESCFSLWAKRLLPQNCIILNICKQLTDLWHSSWDSCIIHHSFIKHSLRIRCRVRLWEYSSVSALRVSFLKKTTITIGSFNTVLISVLGECSVATPGRTPNSNMRHKVTSTMLWQLRQGQKCSATQVSRRRGRAFQEEAPAPGLWWEGARHFRRLCNYRGWSRGYRGRWPRKVTAHLCAQSLTEQNWKNFSS